MNKFSAKQISEIVAGQIIGNPDKTVTAFSKIEEAGPDSLSFLGNEQYSPFLFSTKAGVLIISKHLLPENFTNNDMTLIVVPDAYQAFTKLLQLYESMTQKPSGLEQPHHLGKNVTLGKDIYIGSFAYIGNNCTIGKNVKIYPHVYIGDRVTIGDNTILYPGVKIYHDCRIGQNCIIHSGTVIGSDGFGFIPNSDHQREKVPQIGNVIIEDNVEIGSNVSIDRATIGSTIIRKGVKLDNLIQIAHNVEIGENTVIAAQTGIAGSTKIGKNCMIGGQVGIVGHISIADEVKIAAQSGIGSSIKEKGAIVQGSPAFGIGEYKKSYVLFKNLPKLAETIEEIKKKTNLK